ncbi:MAG TPA: prolyl oligopeptidase family serine peptidase [Terriglobales bacterium]|nr:prolyl oligopeptidase family serine peptidase [Terriglobales bacterium]
MALGKRAADGVGWRVMLPKTLRCLSCLIAVLCLVSAAWAGFTLEQVMSYSFPDHLVSAAKSDRVAWVFNQRGVRNIWVADAPGFGAHAITHYTADDGQDIPALALTPDGATAVYVRGTELFEDNSEVTNPTSNVHGAKHQVFAVDVAGGEPRLLGDINCTGEDCEDLQISPDGKSVAWAGKKELWIAPVARGGAARQLAEARGENVSPRWSPDGKRIAFASQRGDHNFIGVYDFGRDSILYLAPSVDRDSLPRWSPDGKQVAFVRQPGNERGLPFIPERTHPWAIWVADATTGAGHEVWHSGPGMDDSFPELTEDVSFSFAAADRIVFASEHDGWNHLYSIRATGGAPTLLTPGQFEVEDVTLSSDRHSILYSSNQDDVDRRHLWRVAVDGGTPQALTRGESMEWKPVETGDGRYIVCLGSTATTPAMPYLLTRGGREILAKEALPADFPSGQLVTPRQVIFPSADGLQIHGQLFVPRGRTRPGPALVWMHGGPIRQMMLGFHYMGYYHNAYAENQYLTSLGYVVLSVNYRMGIMYGRAFREAPHCGPRGAAEYQDIVAAARYLQGLPIVDPHRIGLWGGSYGGLLTAMGLSRNSDIFAAGVDFAGVHDWSVLIAGEPGFKNAPDAEAAKKLAWESSPDASVEHWQSPVLLIQGDDDPDVPFSQTVDLAQRLRANHVRFEQLVFPDEAHDMLLWRNWVAGYKATAEFFNRMLRPDGMSAGR